MREEAHQFPNISEPVLFKIGSNAAENSKLIGASDPDDLWFHLNNASSAHVIAKMPPSLSKKQRLTVVKRGAQLCRRYTNSCADKRAAPVCYTPVAMLTLLDTPGSVEIKHFRLI